MADHAPDWAVNLLPRRRWFGVRIAGPSMAPTLRDGDAVFVRRHARIRDGHLVLACFAELPGKLVVKRAIRRAFDGWWLESDNAFVTDDSRRYGPGVVLGRVVWRYWPPALPGWARRI